MNKKSLYLAIGTLVFVLCLIAVGMRQGQVRAASGTSNLVDGSPLNDSAYASPGDTASGGYADAVDYNDNVCSGKSSTWKFANGYVFWSTKAKAASETKTTLYRSIGWDITFSSDLNGDGSIGSDEQITISVARTIRGSYYSKMNYYYINYCEKKTDGVLYKYSLYAMSYDRLTELAKNHEAAQSGGKTPVTDAVFSADRISVSIDAIMTLVERDADGNETVKGCITSESGTTAAGVSDSANGTVTTSGTIYRCGNSSDYNNLVSCFNAGSIATYRNSGTLKNNKLVIEYYTDASTCSMTGSGGYSVSGSGQIYYRGTPYRQTYAIWQEVQLAELSGSISGEGYTMTGEWTCGKSDFVAKEKETYHTSYLAQFATYPSGKSGIYEANGTLKLYAKWDANGYTVEYYTKMKENAGSYTKIAVQNCKYKQKYTFLKASSTTAPVIDGVVLSSWAEGTGADAAAHKCGASFSDSDFPKAKEANGTVIRLYAVWKVTSYKVTCKETSPSDRSSVFYEIYGLGFTTDETLAKTTSSLDPFYWGKQKKLLKASELSVKAEDRSGYIWNGFWDKSAEKQYFLANGSTVFSSAKTFEKNSTLYGNWKKNYTLTVMYRLGDGVTLSEKGTGYGIDSEGYLTKKGSRVKEEYTASESLTLLAIPDGLKKSGSTRASKWKITGTDTSVSGGKSYTAKTLAKKAGGDLTKENVTVILSVSWSTFQYYVDYYFWDDDADGYLLRATQSCMYDETCTFYTERQMESLHIPSNMEFSGWSKKKNSTSVAYRGGETFKNLSSKADARISLYGVWTGATMTIDLNGNCPSDSAEEVVMGTEKIRYVYKAGFCKDSGSTNLQSSCSIQIPSCGGYVFKGFYSQQKGGTLMIDSAGRSTAALSYSEGERTIYAQWEQRTYRITYHANGGNFAGNAKAVTSGGIAFGAFLPTTSVPSRVGYSFDGYGTSASGDGELWYNRYQNSGNLRYNRTEDTNLYAQWIDDIVPTGIIRASAGTSSSAWTNRNVQLTITGSDAGSGVVKIQLFQKRYFDSTYQIIGEWDCAPQKSFTCTSLVDTNGISSFYCVVWDAAGNTNRRIFGTDTDAVSTTTTTIYMDKVAPSVTETEIADFKKGDETVHVSLYASDDVIER